MVSETCMRCPYGRERAGEYKRFFTIGEDPDEVYFLLLCGEHARRFDMDWNAWVSLADIVPVDMAGGAVRPKPQALQTFGDDEATRRIRKLRERASRQASTKTVVVGEPDYVLIGPRHDEWRLSVHARKRAVERGFTVDQVLKAAAYPEATVPNTNADAPGLRFHFAEPCCAVVDPDTKMIITVHDKLEYLCKSVNNARKADTRSHARSRP